MEEKIKKLLIVDDDENFLRIIKLNLEKERIYEIKTLSTAKNLIEQIHHIQPNLILLDIFMPSVDGIDACEMLNNDNLGRTIPIIVISALDKDTDKLKAYKLGIADYLTKPIDKKSLIAAIEKALKPKTL